MRVACPTFFSDQPPIVDDRSAPGPSSTFLADTFVLRHEEAFPSCAPAPAFALCARGDQPAHLGARLRSQRCMDHLPEPARTFAHARSTAMVPGGDRAHTRTIA